MDFDKAMKRVFIYPFEIRFSPIDSYECQLWTDAILFFRRQVLMRFMCRFWIHVLSVFSKRTISSIKSNRRYVLSALVSNAWLFKQRHQSEYPWMLRFLNCNFYDYHRNWKRLLRLNKSCSIYIWIFVSSKV